MSSQGYGFSSGHVWLWELNHKEGWAPKNRCFWTVVLEKTLESPLDCKEIKPAHPKGNQSWRFTWRIDAEAEAPILWPPDAKNQLTRKDWGQEEKRATEDEWLDGITESMDMISAGSGRWWRTGRPVVLLSMGSQRVGHDWANELNWTEHDQICFTGN